jgi:hypothetical protein
MSKLANALDAFNSDDPEADLTELLDTLLSEATAAEVSLHTFEAAFRFFERHPMCDFGSPGPLVHWLEQAYPQYISALLSSIERRPTEPTLWMASRILNAQIDASTREKLVAALRTAAQRTDIEASTNAYANEWLQLHA